MYRYWVLVVLALSMGSLLTILLTSYAYLSLPSRASATYLLETSKNLVDSIVSQGLTPVYHVEFYYPIKPGRVLVLVRVRGLNGDYSIVVVHNGAVSVCSASPCKLWVETRYPFIGFDVFIRVHRLYSLHINAFIEVSVKRR